MPAQTFFAVFPGIGVVAHMVGAHQLKVVGSIDHPAGMALLPPFCDFQQNGGGQLVIEVVEVAHVRLKILQHQPQLPPGLGGINGLDGIGQLGKLRSPAKIHVGGVGVHSVSHTAALMLHAEILNLVTPRCQAVAQPKNVGLRPAVGVKEFVDHQNFHRIILGTATVFFPPHRPSRICSE